MNDVKREMTDEMKAKLAAAAKAYLDAPANFHAAIIEAAGSGANGNEITEAIGFAYGPDHVRQVIREARAAGKIPPPAAGEPET